MTTRIRHRLTHGYLLPARGMDVFNEAMAQTEAFLISLNLIDRAANLDAR